LLVLTLRQTSFSLDNNARFIDIYRELKTFASKADLKLCAPSKNLLDMMGDIVDEKVEISKSKNACLVLVTLLLIKPSANSEYYSLDLCYKIL